MQILLEHSTVPGTTYDEHLLFGSCSGFLNEMVNLTEAAETPLNKPLKFRGKFQEAEAINKNKRMYPFGVLDENVKRLQEAIADGGLIGELDHAQDSIIHFEKASHKITKLWWENNTLMGEGVILNTPMGKILRSLLVNDGVRIGVSSRGVGNGKVNEDGILVIGESYKLITFDVVADPSTHAAFQERYVGGKHEAYSQAANNFTQPVKNESSGISRNKEVLVALLGGIANKKAKELKARLS